MKFNSKDIKALIREDSEDERYEYIDETGWEDEGKYSYEKFIFKFDGKFYSVGVSRSGSYYSDYYYNYEDWGKEIECLEVEKVEKVIYEWTTVKS
jgi:hypothetical protein